MHNQYPPDEKKKRELLYSNCRKAIMSYLRFSRMTLTVNLRHCYTLFNYTLPSYYPI